MTDQTRWNIDQVQTENKARAHQVKKEMREELVEYINSCGGLELGELYSYMKKRKRGFNDE